jgi:hypothetical protein
MFPQSLGLNKIYVDLYIEKNKMSIQIRHNLNKVEKFVMILIQLLCFLTALILFSYKRTFQRLDSVSVVRTWLGPTNRASLWR